MTADRKSSPLRPEPHEVSPIRLTRCESDDAPIRLTLARFSPHERQDWLAAAVSLLSRAERERVATMSDPDARTEHAVGRALIRLAGAREMGCCPGRLTVAVTETGKPHLPELPYLHVNVSHAGRAVILATASIAPVGVDIAHPEATPPRAQRIAQRFFATAEVRALRELSEDLMADWFASLWAIKEAVGKALGVGLVSALSQVVVDVNATGLRLADVPAGPPAESWTLHQLRAPGGGEKIAVASPAPGVTLAPVSVVSLDRLLDHMEVVVRPGWCSRPVLHAIVG